MEYRKNRTDQLKALLALSQAKHERSTMKDYSQKIEKSPKKNPGELSAAQKRGALIMKLLLKSYSPDECVVWHSLFMPTEIFYAMNIVPFSTEMVSAGLAGAGLSRELVESGENYTQCNDSCSFATCAVGAIDGDLFSVPDFLVTTSQLCDPARKLAQMAAKKYRKKEFFIDIPFGAYSFSREDYIRAIKYVARQLQDMVSFIESETDRRLDHDRLAEIIRVSNEARSWFLKVRDIRKGPALTRGIRMLDFSSVLLNIWGTEESVDVFRTLYCELEQKAAEGGMKNEKYRLGWVHLRPYYDNTIINYLEDECGAYIVAEENNYIFWDELDPENPFESIAAKLLANPAYSDLDIKNRLYAENIKDYRLDGIIGYAHKGCRHFYSALHIASEHFKKTVPFLVIDGDCVDPRAYSFPLIKTRLDSFLDTMSIRKDGF